MCLLWHIFKDGCKGTSSSRIAHFFDKDFIELPRRLGPIREGKGRLMKKILAMWSQRSHRPPKKTFKYVILKT